MNSETIVESVPTLHDLPNSHNPICPILVGIAGGSGSGKTTLCNTIVSEIGAKNCLVISLDSFYKPLTEEQAVGFNFDHPDAYDFDLCYDVIKKLLQRQPAQIPIYNFVKNTREEESETVHACELILFEGILALYNPKLVALMNLKLFVDCDNDIRLYRRVLRDVKERGRDVSGILYQYNKFVKPAFDELIRPTMHHANLIIPGRSDNRVATRFIVQNLRLQLARLQEVKADMNNNAYYADILDSCWLNIQQKGEDAQDTDDLSLYQSDRILLIRDGSDKTDCLQIFNLFSNKFTDSLYMTLMIRFLNYGIKLMLQNILKKATGCKMVYFSDVVQEDIKSFDKSNAVGIIVPFLHEETLAKVHEKVEKLLEKEPSLKIYVVSIFADLTTVAHLCKWKEDIHLVNILCIVNMKALLTLLKENCENGEFNFLDDKVLVQLMLDSSKTELLKEQNQIHMEDEKINHETL